LRDQTPLGFTVIGGTRRRQLILGANYRFNCKSEADLGGLGITVSATSGSAPALIWPAAARYTVFQRLNHIHRGYRGYI